MWVLTIHVTLCKSFNHYPFPVMSYFFKLLGGLNEMYYKVVTQFLAHNRY